MCCITNILEILTVSIFKVEEKEIVRVSEILTVQVLMLRNSIHMSTDLMRRHEVIYTVKFIIDWS
jgi:hypothetical protein